MAVFARRAVAGLIFLLLLTYGAGLRFSKVGSDLIS